MSKRKTKVAKNVYKKRGVESKKRKKKGCGSYGKYKGLKPSEFAGRASDGNCAYSFPINTKSRARNALSRSHYASKPSAIRKRVFQAYPSLLKNSKFNKDGLVKR